MVGPSADDSFHLWHCNSFSSWQASPSNKARTPVEGGGIAGDGSEEVLDTVTKDEISPRRRDGKDNSNDAEGQFKFGIFTTLSFHGCFADWLSSATRGKLGDVRHGHHRAKGFGRAWPLVPWATLCTTTTVTVPTPDTRRSNSGFHRQDSRKCLSHRSTDLWLQASPLHPLVPASTPPFPSLLSRQSMSQCLQSRTFCRDRTAPSNADVTLSLSLLPASRRRHAKIGLNLLPVPRRHATLGLCLLPVFPLRQATLELRLLSASRHRHAILGFNLPPPLPSRHG